MFEPDFVKFSRADLEYIVGAWDAWWRKEHPEEASGIPYSELMRRARQAELHPETLIPHTEAMRQIRENIISRHSGVVSGDSDTGDTKP